MDDWLPGVTSSFLCPEGFPNPCLPCLSVQFAETGIKSDFHLVHYILMILSCWDFQFERKYFDTAMLTGQLWDELCERTLEADCWESVEH